MKSRDNTDAMAALAIGAIVGIGAALIIRARQEDDTHEIVKRLRPLKKRAEAGAREAGKVVRKQVRNTGNAADDLRAASLEIIEELRSTARDVVDDTRSELQRSAKRALREARKAAKSARREVLR